jgi:hypothetical protein
MLYVATMSSHGSLMTFDDVGMGHGATSCWNEK